MMELEFERKDGLSCVEFIYKAVAEYYKCGYELSFLESWSFAFDKQKEQPLSNEGAIERNLYEFHGLKTRTISLPKDEVYGFIFRHISNGSCCMLSTDLFYVPWVPNCYHSRHWKHALLITEITNSGYYSYDFYALTGEILPFASLPNNVVITTFEHMTPVRKINNIDDCINILSDVILSKIERACAFENMERFANVFCDTFDIHAATQDADIFENSDFINGVNRIAQCRFQFAITLEYLHRVFPSIDFGSVATQFRKCAVAWKSIMSLLIKAYLSTDNRRIIMRVSEKIRTVKEQEEKLYGELKHISQGTSFMMSAKSISTNISWTECFPIDISQHYNHKAFGDINNTQKAQLERTGFLLINDTILDRIVNHTLFHFILADVKEAVYDNIECMGQNIAINKKCVAIMLMHHAEYDHQIDFMTLNTPAGQMIVDITSSSWNSTPVLGDVVVWHGTGAFCENNKVTLDPIEKRIFAQCFMFSKEVYVNSLTLPENPNLHIYALSVCS